MEAAFKETVNFVIFGIAALSLKECAHVSKQLRNMFANFAGYIRLTLKVIIFGFF